jgi:hypothetical protein
MRSHDQDLLAGGGDAGMAGQGRLEASDDLGMRLPSFVTFPVNVRARLRPVVVRPTVGPAHLTETGIWHNFQAG